MENWLSFVETISAYVFREEVFEAPNKTKDDGAKKKKKTTRRKKNQVGPLFKSLISLYFLPGLTSIRNCSHSQSQGQGCTVHLGCIGQDSGALLQAWHGHG